MDEKPLPKIWQFFLFFILFHPLWCSSPLPFLSSLLALFCQRQRPLRRPLPLSQFPFLFLSKRPPIGLSACYFLFFIFSFFLLLNWCSYCRCCCCCFNSLCTQKRRRFIKKKIKENRPTGRLTVVVDCTADCTAGGMPNTVLLYQSAVQCTVLGMLWNDDDGGGGDDVDGDAWWLAPLPAFNLKLCKCVYLRSLATAIAAAILSFS